MNLLDLVNGSLQTIATALVASGGYIVFQGGRLLEGSVLIVAGLVAYVLYEVLPSNPK